MRLKTANKDDDGNILANYVDLQRLIVPHHSSCKMCKTGQLDLQKILISGLCTDLELACTKCKTNEIKEREKLKYLKKKLHSLKKEQNYTTKRQVTNRVKN